MFFLISLSVVVGHRFTGVEPLLQRYNRVLSQFRANVVLNGMVIEEHKRRAAALGKTFDLTHDNGWRESWLNLNNWKVKTKKGTSTGIKSVFDKLSVRQQRCPASPDACMPRLSDLG
jgi:hypothetical protein